MTVAYPLRFDGRGRTADTTADGHIRDLIEQVLFTAPGERVNRPDFGSGILQLVFAPNGDAMAAATQSSVQGALQRWLGELIVVEDVSVDNIDAELRITVQYVVVRSQRRETAAFVREVPGP
jgi:phage baseplate assembly protein W